MKIQHLAVGLLAAMALTTSVNAADPLPSWNDGAAKKSITAFSKK